MNERVFLIRVVGGKFHWAIHRPGLRTVVPACRQGKHEKNFTVAMESWGSPEEIQCEECCRIFFEEKKKKQEFVTREEICL